MKSRLSGLRLAQTAVLVACAASLAAAPVPGKVEFNRHVRPIMANTCFKCHGPDAENNKSKLRLDLPEVSRAPMRSASGRTFTALVPGRPDQSEVWRRINSADRGEVMPPPDSLHQLTAHDKAVLKRWIEQGANYQPHWAYLPPTQAEPPAGPGAPIDRFIRAELSARGLTPSAPADRRALIRRVTLDLLGLPPTPAEVEAFLADDRPDAYGRLVDRLLASPHYGERMAVPWLDLVRFADSVGFHGDQLQNIFPYRDYVIDAFNANKPFDQFVREQLAGDLLPDATEEQHIASGFNRLNMMTREGGAQPKEYLAKYAADRVRATSTAFLGSTLACAECHDHKFDPFTTRDFYATAAYFADIKQWGVYANYKYTPEPELKGFDNDHPFPPELEVGNAALQRRLARLRDSFAARKSEVARELAANPASLAAVRAWVASVAPRLAADPGGWAAAEIVSTKPNSTSIALALPDGSVRFDARPSAPKADQPKSDEGKQDPAPAAPATPADKQHVLTLKVPAGPLATLRIEALPDDAQGGRVARDDKEKFSLKLQLALLRAGATAPEPVPIADAFADGETQSYFNGHTRASQRKDWISARSRVRERQAVDYLLAPSLTLAPGDQLIATVTSADVARVRLAVSPLGGRLPTDPLPAEIRAAFAAPAPSPAQLESLAGEYFLSTGTPAPAHRAALAQLLAIAECFEGRAYTMVTVATTPTTTRVLPRGNWQDDSGEVVLPEPPRFLTRGYERPRVVPAAPRARQTRLDLANWIVSRDNPLTARTFVNRLWKQFFGTGLSAVLDDLGAQGEYPTHPELLDWLAVEFMDRQWDVKHMVRLIVTSETYRQSSVNRPELRDVDPQNRLLARQNARRLDAEFVRDNALFAAGLLNPELGGPSATPYQPEGYYAQLNFPLRTYEAETDERQYRRGLYTHWQRTFLHPMLANFDAPSREECTAARTLSSTPQQALTLLNDPTFVEAARVLAEEVMAAAPAQDFGARLDSAFRRVLSRPATGREAESLRAHFDAQLATYRSAPDDARKLAAVGLHPVPPGTDLVELAAWTSVARVVLNLNETIVVY